MDPNATLAKIRMLIATICNDEYEIAEMATEYGEDLAMAVRDLDQWLERGGYLPTPWDGPRHPRPTTATGGGL